MKLCLCEDVVILVVITTLILTHVSSRARQLWRKCNLADCSALIRSHVQHAIDILSALFWAPNADTFRERAITQKLEQRRLRWAHSSSATGATYLSAALALTVWNIVVENPRWMTAGQDVAAIAFLAVFVVAGNFLRFTRRLVDVFYATVMIINTCFLAFSTPNNFLFAEAATCFLRLPCGLFNLQVGHAIFWNLACTCISCIAVSTRNSGNSDVPKSMNYILELAMCFGSILTVSGFKESILSELRLDIDAANQRAEKSASMLLLDMVCDVIVELTSDLTITHDSRGFAALLMRSSGKPVTSLPFCDFIFNEVDRVMFMDKISALRMGPEETVGTCRVSLSDSLCNHVKVEMFFVKVCVDEGELRYIIGIREFTDEIPSMQSFQKKTQKSKTARQVTGNGTPPMLEHVSFDTALAKHESQAGHADEAGQTSPETQSAHVEVPEKNDNLHFAKLAPSRVEAQSATILMTMGSWNCKVPRTTCCSYHAYAMDAKIAVRRLLQHECMDGFPLHSPSGVQCQQCGMLQPDWADHQQESCKLCSSTELVAFADSEDGEHNDEREADEIQTKVRCLRPPQLARRKRISTYMHDTL
eukprot:TRINITY_DN11027_c0_g2_i4.p1 TRINITY_DN11027_c0_g2~~TRINITY_DN11027_c0_g2_i4.p1  ORF type:complete len:590 (+),score=73.83 TRINITY_DN11027_c0_g2_i4:119-1888(+)